MELPLPSARLRLLAVLCLLVAPVAWAGAPAGAGKLISQTPLAGAPSGATAWRIRYQSVAESGALVDITGVLIAPSGPAPKAGRDVVSWGHSTVGIADACAPSTNAKLFENISGLPAMLAHGDVVVATDFQGLGTPGPHPYLVGVSSGRAMLDAVRAARAVPAAGAGKRFVLWGESQGAHAALWAAKLAPTYAPELDLQGVAAAAPPTDLIANFNAITNPAIRALMTGYTSESWSAIYGYKISTFANGAGRFLIHKLAKDCLHLDAVAAGTTVGLLVATNQIPAHLGKPWTKELVANSVAPQHFGVPLLLAQGSDDSVVMPKVTKAFAAKSCHAGNAVRYIRVDGGDHLTIAPKSADLTIAWITDRFAHKPPPSDCASLEETVGDR